MKAKTSSIHILIMYKAASDIILQIVSRSCVCQETVMSLTVASMSWQLPR